MPEGSSSAAPVTKPGPSNRSSMFRGFLTSERIGSVMKIFDTRDQSKAPTVRNTFFIDRQQVHTFNTETPCEFPRSRRHCEKSICAIDDGSQSRGNARCG